MARFVSSVRARNPKKTAKTGGSVAQNSSESKDTARKVAGGAALSALIEPDGLPGRRINNDERQGQREVEELDVRESSASWSELTSIMRRLGAAASNYFADLVDEER